MESSNASHEPPDDKVVSHVQQSASKAEASLREEAVPPVLRIWEKGREASLVALCAEPGMGKHDLVNEVVAQASDAGFKIYRRELWGQAPADAADQLVRLARSASRFSNAGKQVFVAIEGLPPSDEGCVRRQARALRKMLSAGVTVVFSLAPEARQLFEVLPACPVLGVDELLVKEVLDLPPNSPQYRLRSLTRGIPALVKALRDGDSFVESEEVVPIAYYDALGSLVGLSLRRTLADEVLRLRLCMLLLGSGTIHDLDAVLGGVARDVLAETCADAPVYGISDDLQRFDCLSAGVNVSYAAYLSGLQSACDAFPSVWLACTRHLVQERGDYARSALVCHLGSSTESSLLVLEHAPGFLDVGETGLVRRGIEMLAPDEGKSDGFRDFRLLSDALAAVSSRDADCERLRRTCKEQNQSQGEYDVRLFVAARLCLNDAETTVSGWDGPLSMLGTRLAAHRKAFGLMCEGHVSAAYRLLVSIALDDGSPTVSSALLKADYESACLLLGDGPGCGAAEAEKSFKPLASSEGLYGYVAIARLVRALTCGRGAGDGAESLVGAAERTGDALVQACALIAGCLFDLGAASYARASVRSALATAVAQGANATYLARIAALLGALARHMLGEEASFGINVDPNDDLGLIERLAIDAAMPDDAGAYLLDSEFSEPPRDSLWLLVILLCETDELSRLLWRRVPASWNRAIKTVWDNWCAEESPHVAVVNDNEDERLLGAAGKGPSLALVPKKRVEIGLLGGFTVIVGGMRVEESKLDRRNAKSVIEFLALQPKGSARRYQIVEQVWPESDYSAGFNKAYQAATAFRVAVREIDSTLEPLVTSRPSKSISLNRDVVRCDVDEFRRCAREAVSCDDDELTVSMARRTEQLYVGDLYVPPKDATGFVAAKRAELKGLYADAMVAGADAAFRLGNRRMATRFATNATLADGLREDAVIVLVRSLRASGRNAEAAREYQGYANRLAKATKRSPSQILRLAAGEDLGGVGNDGEGSQGGASGRRQA